MRCVLFPAVFFAANLATAMAVDTGSPDSAREHPSDISDGPATLCKRRDALRFVLASEGGFEKPRTTAPAASSAQETPAVVSENTESPSKTDSVSMPALDELPDGVLAMKKLIVTAPKLPGEPAPENRVQKFFRTGTILQHEGKKITTRLWIKGDDGIMLRFSW